MLIGEIIGVIAGILMFLIVVFFLVVGWKVCDVSEFKQKIDEDFAVCLERNRLSKLKSISPGYKKYKYRIARKRGVSSESVPDKDRYFQKVEKSA